MDEFTDALMVALHAGADDPDRSAMAARMKVLVAELTNQKSTKVKKDAATRELYAYRQHTLTAQRFWFLKRMRIGNTP